MPHNALKIVLLMIPVAIGGIIAAVNSSQVNDITESAEAWLRKRQQRTSASSGWFSRSIFNPILWTIVTFCDWTDGFTHRGLKNGTRVAATLYLIAAWLLILYAAVIIAVALVILAVVIYIAAKVMSSSTGDSGVSHARGHAAHSRDEDAVDSAGLKGKRIYSGTNWFNEELKGRVDDEGNLYKGTSWFNEDKIGRIDGDGNIYKGTSRTNETKVGRIDKEGTLYKSTNWFNEEKRGPTGD